MIAKWIGLDVRWKLELTCFLPNIAMSSIIDNDHVVRIVVFIYKIGDFRIQSRFPFYWRYLVEFGLKMEIFVEYLVQCVHLNRTRLVEWRMDKGVLRLCDLPRFLCISCHHPSKLEGDRRPSYNRICHDNVRLEPCEMLLLRLRLVPSMFFGWNSEEGFPNVNQAWREGAMSTCLLVYTSLNNKKWMTLSRDGRIRPEKAHGREEWGFPQDITAGSNTKNHTAHKSFQPHQARAV